MKIIDQLKKAVKRFPIINNAMDESEKNDGASLNPLNFVKKSIKVKKEGHSVDFKRLSGDLDASEPKRKHSHSMSMPSQPFNPPINLDIGTKNTEHDNESVLSKKDLENIEKGLPLTNDDLNEPLPPILEGPLPNAEPPSITVTTEFTSVNMAAADGRMSEIGLPSIEQSLPSTEILTTAPLTTSPMQQDAKSIASSLSTGNQLQIGLGGKARRKKYLEFNGEADARKLAKQIYLALLKLSRKYHLTSRCPRNNS